LKEPANFDEVVSHSLVRICNITTRLSYWKMFAQLFILVENIFREAYFSSIYWKIFSHLPFRSVE